MTLPSPGTFAVCEATTYPVAAVASDCLNLRLLGPDAPVPAHVTQGEDRQGRQWVKVPKRAIERYFSRHVTVAWRGEEFGLGRVTGDTAEIHGGSPPIAERLGLEGDQYNGFRAVVPVDELTLVDVQEKEIDV